MKLPKHAELWLPGYLNDRIDRWANPTDPQHLYVALTDHYEPMGGSVSLETGLARVAAWQNRWPQIAASAPRDAGGNAPRFTMFYPQEEYHPHILRAMEQLCADKTADVEVHIHHDHDNAEIFEAKMTTFLRQLHEDHGFLHHHNGQLVFGFIHGNWALDNSRPDGRWCGVTGELQILRRLGCYADFTMPSTPSATQSRILNRIYWTAGDPAHPRGFDTGHRAIPGEQRADGLLIVPGPLGLRYRDRLAPRIETGELAAYDAPTRDRVRRWLALAPQLGDSIFLKIFGHSAREDNAAALLGANPGEGTLRVLFQHIAEAAAERGLKLHWTTAFEMFTAINQTLDGAA